MKLSLARFIVRTIADSRLREVLREREGVRGDAPRRRTAADVDPPTLEGGRERPRGGRGRAVRAAGVDVFDGERRERRGLEAEVARLPTGRVPARVEVALVADDAARDAADSPGREVAREEAQVALLEGGVAVPDEDEVPSPDTAGEHSVADDLGSEAVAGAEEPERREGDSELLHRGRRECPRGVQLEHDLARPQVDGERRSPARGDPGCAERPAEPRLEAGRLSLRRRPTRGHHRHHSRERGERPPAHPRQPSHVASRAPGRPHPRSGIGSNKP